MHIKINGKEISEDKPCFIIAEAGVNHNGDINLAFKLIDAAVKAGADAVKFQTFKSENVVTKDVEMAEYQKKNIGGTESQFDMIKKLELPFEEFKELKSYCDKKGIIFLSTPHSSDAIDFLYPLVPTYKIGSGDLTNIPFLKKIAQKGKPIILSTGMSNIDEVKEAVNIIKKEGNDQIIVLHCTSNYPCDLKDVNLRAMNTIKDACPGVLVGYSDHTLGIDVMKLAAKYGAVIIEKHYTIDKNLPGPDHKASMDPKELKQAVNAIKNKDYDVVISEEVIMGSPEKKPTPNEEEISKLVRKSIVAKVNIPKGTILSKDMLIIKRPGIGIKPRYINKIIGKKSSKTIQKDSVLSELDIS